jgi:hypothetical protein
VQQLRIGVKKFELIGFRFAPRQSHRAIVPPQRLSRKNPQNRVFGASKSRGVSLDAEPSQEARPSVTHRFNSIGCEAAWGRLARVPLQPARESARLRARSTENS